MPTSGPRNKSGQYLKSPVTPREGVTTGSRESMPPQGRLDTLATHLELFNIAREESRSYRTLLLASVTTLFAVPITTLSVDHTEFLRTSFLGWPISIYVIIFWVIGCVFLALSLWGVKPWTWLGSRKLRQAVSAMESESVTKAQTALLGAIEEELKSGATLHGRVRLLVFGIGCFGISLGAEFIAFLNWAWGNG